jgi:DHA2 family multidrug resistance protein
MASLNLGIDAHTAAMYRVYQAIPLAFLFIPINTVCYIGIPREQNNQVSGMMNLARNIGGSVGISFLTTMVARRSQAFQNGLVGHVTAANPYLQERLAELQRAFSVAGPAQAARRAYGAVHAAVLQQAGLLSYVSIVRDLAIVSALFVPLVLVLVKRNEPGSTPAGAH